MKFNKDDFKRQINMDMIFNLLQYLGGNPERKSETVIIADTICHNHPGEGSHKLYCYLNNDMTIFHCYTNCNSFDVFELLMKVQAQKGVEWTMYDAAKFLNNFFALNFEEKINNTQEELKDWQYFTKWNSVDLAQQEQKIEFRILNEKFLYNLPRPHFLNWERDGITKEVCDARNICYDPGNDGIVIPHYDINGKLIGVRERTLIKEEEINGKYKPAVFNGELLNHPLGFNLYNLNWSKENIKRMKTAIVFEAEKSCMQFASYFGLNNDITCAICGSNFSKYQFNLLKKLNVQEIVIALDKQYYKDDGEEWAKWTRKFIDIFNKYGKYVKFSFIVDRKGLLEYKDSPTDKGKEIFLKLYNNRENI